MAKIIDHGLAKAGDRVLSGSWSVRSMVRTSSKKKPIKPKTEQIKQKSG